MIRETIRIYWGVLLVKIKWLLGKEPSQEGIPEGPYCYSYSPDKGEVKMCPNYEVLGGGKSACLYVGYAGDDVLLSDQCKICSVNVSYRDRK